MTIAVICTQYTVHRHIIVSVNIVSMYSHHCSLPLSLQALTNDQFSKVHDQLLTATVSQKCHKAISALAQNNRSSADSPLTY